MKFIYVFRKKTPDNNIQNWILCKMPQANKISCELMMHFKKS